MDQIHPTTLTKSKWLWYTTAGWFTGFVFSLLIGLPLEAIGIGNQSMIGIGMGAGVGLLQARLVRRYGISAKDWFWTTFSGMSIPYITYDVLAVKIKLVPEEVLPFATAIGSLMVGGLQYHYLLKSISKKSTSWILLTCAGWTLAHISLSALNPNFIKQFHLPVILQFIFAVTIIVCGGPLLGLITGWKMVSILKPKGND